MSDSVALFAAATGARKRTNLATGAATPTTTTIGAMTKLMRLMRGEADDPEHPGEPGHFRPLAQRIAQFLEVPDNKDTVEDLIGLIRPLELIELNEELNLLLQSGEQLSDAAEARKLELFRITRDMKLEISQRRPISG
jgi:DNA primase